jgi:hypothetical protein
MKKNFAIRRALPILVAVVLLTAICVDVVAAGVKAVSRGNRAAYPASGGAVTMTAPNSVRNFPAALLPQ